VDKGSVQSRIKRLNAHRSHPYARMKESRDANVDFFYCRSGRYESTRLKRRHEYYGRLFFKLAKKTELNIG
jgi:hypothetical protein